MQDVLKIVRQRLKAAKPALSHPDADVLTAFAERALPELERATVLEHLALCGDCRDIVALALAASEPAETSASRSPSLSGGWLTWPALRWGVVAAGVVAIASFGILQYHRRFQPATMALRQSANTEVAANEPKKAVAPFAASSAEKFAASPAEKKEKLQSPAAPAFADSVDHTSAADEKKSAARAETPSTPAAGPQGGSSLHGAAVGALLPHGPRLANAWQQQNTVQNQAPVPAPPSAYSKQERATGDLYANRGAPAASETVQGRAGAPAITQNADVAQVSGQTAGKTGTYRAKPAVPPALGAEAAINNQPSQDQVVRKLKTEGVPGQLGGLVVDPSGAAVSNARITVTPSNTGTTATAVTDSQGAWLIAGLPTGNYRAQAEAPGFRTTALDFSYDARQPSMYSFTLSPGSVSETVEVAAQNVQVQTEGANIGGPITNRQMSQISVNGRNATQLSALSAGLIPRWTISAAGGLQRSFDNGSTWQTVDVAASPDSFSSTGGRSLEIVAKTSRAKAAKEKDSSQTRKQDSATVTFRAVAASGSDVWAGGSPGALYHSLDAGDHWTRIVPAVTGANLTGDVISLEFPDLQHGKVSTSTSEVWTTSDDGQTWQKQ